MTDLILIIVLAGVLSVLRVYYLVKKHIRGTGLGMRLAGGHESENAQETRKRRYIRGATRESEDAVEKYSKKVNRSRTLKGQMRSLSKLDIAEKSLENDRAVALRVAYGSGNSHGIRKAGTERGRKKI